MGFEPTTFCLASRQSICLCRNRPCLRIRVDTVWTKWPKLTQF